MGNGIVWWRTTTKDRAVSRRPGFLPGNPNYFSGMTPLNSFANFPRSKNGLALFLSISNCFRKAPGRLIRKCFEAARYLANSRRYVGDRAHLKLGPRDLDATHAQFRGWHAERIPDGEDWARAPGFPSEVLFKSLAQEFK